MENYTIALDDGLDLRQLVTTGSVLHINEDYEHNDFETDKDENKSNEYIGEPIKSFKDLEKNMVPVDSCGYVKKKILEEGGGALLNENFTVSVCYSGYWENETEPFDFIKIYKPMVVDLKENGLLPGLQIAIKSMLVGEMSIFYLSHQVMYGELGIPPRIKPKAECIFYIKLIKCIITPKEGDFNIDQPNNFQKVHHEVKKLYSCGLTLYKTVNSQAALQVFRKAVFMLHKCRLANREEEIIQEKTLVKLYTNLAICYNKTKQPLKACIACNELNRLNSLWNNGKVLFQNAKSLRMIGQFSEAKRRLTQAMKLSKDMNGEMQKELDLLNRLNQSFDKQKLLEERLVNPSEDTLVSQSFKDEVNNLIKSFKEDDNLCKLSLPTSLNPDEVRYIQESCIAANLFFNKAKKEFALDKSVENIEDTCHEENQNIYEGSLIDLV